MWWTQVLKRFVSSSEVRCVQNANLFHQSRGKPRKSYDESRRAMQPIGQFKSYVPPNDIELLSCRNHFHYNCSLNSSKTFRVMQFSWMSGEAVKSQWLGIWPCEIWKRHPFLTIEYITCSNNYGLTYNTIRLDLLLLIWKIFNHLWKIKKVANFFWQLVHFRIALECCFTKKKFVGSNLQGAHLCNSPKSAN